MRGVRRETVAGRWDAGELGCGELVLGLRGRMAALPAGFAVELVATDAGVPADLPSWCRLTAHELVNLVKSGAQRSFLVSKGPLRRPDEAGKPAPEVAPSSAATRLRLNRHQHRLGDTVPAAGPAHIPERPR